MYMLPHVRGAGHGRSLLARCLREAGEAGYSRCYLQTTSRMVKARRLYEAAGFEVTTGPQIETAPSCCETWMARTLDAL